MRLIEAAKNSTGPIGVVKTEIHGRRPERRVASRRKLQLATKGGVRLEPLVEEVKTFATQMLGRTRWSGADRAQRQAGEPLYIEDGATRANNWQELYLRRCRSANEPGGVRLLGAEALPICEERVAPRDPERIHTFAVDPATGELAPHGRAAADALGLAGDLAKQAESLVRQLYGRLPRQDMSMLEINP